MEIQSETRPPSPRAPEASGKVETLSRSSLCKDLSRQEIEILAGVMAEESFAEGQAIAQENEANRTLYVLAEGVIQVRRTNGPKEETVHTMKVGEVAGTRDFVDGLPRQAMLRAGSNGRVLTLKVSDFEGMLHTQQNVVYKVMRGIFRITHENLMRMNTETNQLQDYLMRTGNRH